MMPAGTVLFSSGAPIGYIAIAMLPGVEANHITFHNVGTVAATLTQLFTMSMIQ